MRWKRPHHTRWLAACLLGLLISSVVGGFSLRVAAVFVVIFGVGAALLNLDDPDDEIDAAGETVPYPEDYPDSPPEQEAEAEPDAVAEPEAGPEPDAVPDAAPEPAASSEPEAEPEPEPESGPDQER